MDGKFLVPLSSRKAAARNITSAPETRFYLENRRVSTPPFCNSSYGGYYTQATLIRFTTVSKCLPLHPKELGFMPGALPIPGTTVSE